MLKKQMAFVGRSLSEATPLDRLNVLMRLPFTQSLYNNNNEFFMENIGLVIDHLPSFSDSNGFNWTLTFFEDVSIRSLSPQQVVQVFTFFADAANSLHKNLPNLKRCLRVLSALFSEKLSHVVLRDEALIGSLIIKTVEALGSEDSEIHMHALLLHRSYLFCVATYPDSETLIPRHARIALEATFVHFLKNMNTKEDCYRAHLEVMCMYTHMAQEDSPFIKKFLDKFLSMSPDFLASDFKGGPLFFGILRELIVKYALGARETPVLEHTLRCLSRVGVPRLAEDSVNLCTEIALFLLLMMRNFDLKLVTDKKGVLTRHALRLLANSSPHPVLYPCLMHILRLGPQRDMDAVMMKLVTDCAQVRDEVHFNTVDAVLKVCVACMEDSDVEVTTDLPSFHSGFLSTLLKVSMDSQGTLKETGFMALGHILRRNSTLVLPFLETKACKVWLSQLTPDEMCTQPNVLEVVGVILEDNSSWVTPDFSEKLLTVCRQKLGTQNAHDCEQAFVIFYILMGPLLREQTLSLPRADSILDTICRGLARSPDFLQLTPKLTGIGCGILMRFFSQDGDVEVENNRFIAVVERCPGLFLGLLDCLIDSDEQPITRPWAFVFSKLLILLPEHCQFPELKLEALTRTVLSQFNGDDDSAEGTSRLSACGLTLSSMCRLEIPLFEGLSSVACDQVINGLLAYFHRAPLARNSLTMGLFISAAQVSQCRENLMFRDVEHPFWACFFDATPGEGGVPYTVARLGLLMELQSTPLQGPLLCKYQAAFSRLAFEVLGDVTILPSIRANVLSLYLNGGVVQDAERHRLWVIAGELGCFDYQLTSSDFSSIFGALSLKEKIELLDQRVQASPEGPFSEAIQNIVRNLLPTIFLNISLSSSHDNYLEISRLVLAFQALISPQKIVIRVLSKLCSGLGDTYVEIQSLLKQYGLEISGALEHERMSEELAFSERTRKQLSISFQTISEDLDAEDSRVRLKACQDFFHSAKLFAEYFPKNWAEIDAKIKEKHYRFFWINPNTRNFNIQKWFDQTGNVGIMCDITPQYLENQAIFGNVSKFTF